MDGRDTNPYQGALFKVAAGDPKHWFYGTSNQYVFKFGKAARRSGNGVADVRCRMKGDRQFKGHEVVFAILCDCALPDGHCHRERNVEEWFAEERLPSSEQYGRSEDIDNFADRMVGGDRRGQAVLAWVRQVKVTRAA